MRINPVVSSLQLYLNAFAYDANNPTQYMEALAYLQGQVLTQIYGAGTFVIADRDEMPALADMQKCLHQWSGFATQQDCTDYLAWVQTCVGLLNDFFAAASVAVTDGLAFPVLPVFPAAPIVSAGGQLPIPQVFFAAHVTSSLSALAASFPRVAPGGGDDSDLRAALKVISDTVENLRKSVDMRLWYLQTPLSKIAQEFDGQDPSASFASEQTWLLSAFGLVQEWWSAASAAIADELPVPVPPALPDVDPGQVPSVPVMIGKVLVRVVSNLFLKYLMEVLYRKLTGQPVPGGGGVGDLETFLARFVVDVHDKDKNLRVTVGAVEAADKLR